MVGLLFGGAPPADPFEFGNRQGFRLTRGCLAGRTPF